MTTDNSDNKVIRLVDGRSHSAESQANPTQRARAEDAVCQFCFGTGTRLEAGEEGIKGAVICECRRSNSGTRFLDAARIPPRFRECSFHNYYPKNDSQYFAHSFASRLVDDYPAIDAGLLFMGSVGVGKTHLAIAVLKDLIQKKGVNCLFYESGSLLKAIQDSYNPVSQNSEMRVLAPVYQAEVLVLDELGASIPTNWVRDTMYQIINTRYNNKKLTIFTTNYLDEPCAVAEENSEAGEAKRRSRTFAAERIQELTTLEERIGTPLRSRLYEMCKKVMIEGEDYRKRLDQRRTDSPSA
ncbi:MAG TPA: ATP-binding protein [Pyrinomonadaceae bacterium]|jgi:DNA replication protein DnaC|nr:ATP-binding protein [Pyrinomonadaceae bacterium]